MGCGAVGLALVRSKQEVEEPGAVPLALARNTNRSVAIETALCLLELPSFEGKDVLVKGSFNSADPSPASTSPEALRAVVAWLRAKECGKVTLIERSGMGRTGDVWRKLGIFEIAKDLDIDLLALDELAATQWKHESLPGWHWKHGVEVPALLGESCIVQICNLKTHRFGGVFSGSLKNSVGLIAKYSMVFPERWNYMAELHSSPDQQQLIAEINQLYHPAVIVMDAGEVFCSGGPEKGEIASPAAAAATTDRVALDAAGVALLRLHGAGTLLGEGRAFDQPQVKRAAELNLGVRSAKEIRFLTADRESANLAARIDASLNDPADKAR